METAIEVRGLVKRYGPLTAVDGLDLEIRAGECFALLGPNGAGKTTTVEILEGILDPTAGEVRVLGRAWDRDGHSLRQRIGIALQETQVAERLTVREILALFRSFYDRGLDPVEVIAAVGLESKRDAWVMKLSGGQRQRLAIGCALVGDPEVLFLDEPTTGLDPQSRRSIWEIVQGYKRRGRTVLLTTHYMDEAERLCDRVAIIDLGRIIALGTPRELIGRLGGTQVVEFTTDPPVEPGALAGLPGVRAARMVADRVSLTVDALHVTVPALLDRLRDDGLALTGLSTHQASLEDVFVALTGRRLREDQ